jgi:4-hydroxy 2-oxovalerate aldolase
MMSHLADAPTLAGQAKLMESYGAHCIYITDSGGRLTMNGIRDRVRAYRDVHDPRHMTPRHRTRSAACGDAISVIAPTEYRRPAMFAEASISPASNGSCCRFCCAILVRS